MDNQEITERLIGKKIVDVSIASYHGNTYNLTLGLDDGSTLSITSDNSDNMDIFLKEDKNE